MVTIVYIQRDLEQINRTLDKILRPYKTDVKNLRMENASLRGNISYLERSLEDVLVIVVQTNPELFERALAALVDKDRRGWKKFRSSWQQRIDAKLRNGESSVP